MNFTFTEDQNTFADATRAVLTAEVTADRIRDRWLTASGIDGPLLQQIQELGLPGMLVPRGPRRVGLGANGLCHDGANLWLRGLSRAYCRTSDGDGAPVGRCSR